MKLFRLNTLILIVIILLITGCAAINHNSYHKKIKKKNEPCDCPEFKKNKKRISYLMDLSYGTIFKKDLINC